MTDILIKLTGAIFCDLCQLEKSFWLKKIKNHLGTPKRTFFAYHQKIKKKILLELKNSEKDIMF